MKQILTKIFIFCFLFFEINAFGQNIEIPDENFKAFLIENFDIDNDLEISEIEAGLIIQMSLSNEEIKSISGIENLPNLNSLSIFGTGLDTLDLSQNKEIEHITSFGQVKHLNIQNLEKLKEVRLTSSNTFSPNNEGLETFIFQNNINLESLQLYGGTIQEFDFSNLNSLRNLTLSEYPIHNFSTIGLENLEVLALNELELDSLNVANLDSLKSLRCHSNKLRILELGELKNLEKIWANNNELSSVDIQGLDNLEFLELSYNLLDSIQSDLYSINLKHIKIAANSLDEFPSEFYPSLETLEIPDNPISEIDLSMLDSLTRLIISRTNIKVLDMSNNTELKEIGTSGCHDLEYLNLQNGSIETGLGISNLHSIKSICVDQSQAIQVEENLNNNNYFFELDDGPCFIILPAESQKLLPEGLELTYFRQDFSGSAADNNTLRIDGGTIINDQVVQIATFEHTTCDLRPKKNYLISNKDSILSYNEESDTFELLYDFSLDLGDTMQIKIWNPSLAFDTDVYAKVQAIDSVLIAGKYRKRMNVIYDNGQNETIDFTNSYLEADWIEGFGSTVNFFHFEGLGLCDESYNRCLVSAYEPPGNFLGFESCITNTDDSELVNTFKLFPNPTLDQLNIENTEAKIDRVIITNFLGMVVLDIQIPPNKSLHTIDVTHLATGVYMILLCEKESQKMYQNKFIKH